MIFNIKLIIFLIKIANFILLASVFDPTGHTIFADEKNGYWVNSSYESWTLHTDGYPDTEYYLHISENSPCYPESQWTGLYLIELQERTPEKLEAYYAKHISRDEDWELLKYKISGAYGLMPFAYAHPDDKAVALYDGARHWLGRQEAALFIPGDFPCGTYTLSSLCGKMVFRLTVRRGRRE